MTKLAIFIVYDCFIILLLFSTTSRPLCRNYNFELLIKKHYILRANSEESMWVILKRNTVLPGMAY